MNGSDAGMSKSRNNSARPLLVAGAVLLLSGLALLGALHGYSWMTDRENAHAQHRLVSAWETGAFSGEGVARLRIPKLGVDAIVVELKSPDDLESLKNGPGHVAGTAMPGREGNVVIAGHRTLYGAPFGRIDRLETCDRFTLETRDGLFEYLVTRQLVIDDSDVSILEQSGPPRVTLFACHPPHYAKQRIAVVGVLVAENTRPAGATPISVRAKVISGRGGD